MRAWSETILVFLRRISGRKGAGATTANAKAGEAGERAAEAHLKANGLRILVRNWRNPADEREELDLVCEEQGGAGRGGTVLVFVEVKARVAGARVGGYQAVDRRKKSVLLRACRAYLARLRPTPAAYRFDIVEIVHAGDARRREAVEAMRLDPRVASFRDGREVWHYRDVPLFPGRSNHRHEHRHG